MLVIEVVNLHFRSNTIVQMYEQINKVNTLASKVKVGCPNTGCNITSYSTFLNNNIMLFFEVQIWQHCWREYLRPILF